MSSHNKMPITKAIFADFVFPASFDHSRWLNSYLYSRTKCFPLFRRAGGKHRAWSYLSIFVRSAIFN